MFGSFSQSSGRFRGLQTELNIKMIVRRIYSVIGLLVLLTSVNQSLSQDEERTRDPHNHQKVKKSQKLVVQKTADGDFHIQNELENSMKYWNDKAQNKLMQILNKRNSLTTKKAKNVIFFLGDGMGISTVAATRMLTGKEENILSFEKFPFYGLSKTHCGKYFDVN